MSVCLRLCLIIFRKIREKYIKAERKRLIELYRIAFKCDPRIKKYNEQLEKEKDLLKQEKFDKKQKAREEKKRVENAVSEIK